MRNASWMTAAVALMLVGDPVSNVVATDLFVGGQNGYHTYRIPAMVTCANGTVLAFCEGRKTSARDDGDIDLLLRRSPDGGATWTDAQVVYEEGGDAPITIGNPCPIVDRQTGRVHLLFCRNNQRVFYTASDDQGARWSAPREITDALRAFDYAWTRVGTGPGHGLQLRQAPCQNRLLVPIWLNTRIGADYRAAALLSDDGGKTWQTGGLVGPEIPNTNECMAFEFQDAQGPAVGLNMRARDTHVRSVAVSRDGGQIWSKPQRIESLPDPVCQAAILDVDLPAGDRLLLFSNPSDPKRRARLTVQTSLDQGLTWNSLVTLHPGPSGYSDLAVLPDGAIGALYERGTKSYCERLTLARFPLAGSRE